MALAARHSADPKSPSSTSRSSRNPSAVVPMGIWLCAPTTEEYHDTRTLPDGISRRLVTRVVAEFSQSDSAIVVTGSSPDAEHVAALAASCTDRHITALPVTYGDQDETAGETDNSERTQALPGPRAGLADLVLALAVSTPPSEATSTVFSRWARWLRPGGTLTVITANPAGPGSFANHAGTVVTAAEAAGLAYLQHVIAVLAHVEGDRLLVEGPRHGPPPPRPRDTVHVPAHIDVLIFVSSRA